MSTLATLMWRFDLIEQAKARLERGDASLQPALDRLLAEAEDAVQSGPFSVIHKTRLPASGDPHDYIAPYADPDLPWPHPQIAPLRPERLSAILYEAAAVYQEPRYPDGIAKMAVDDVRAQRANLLWASTLP